MNKQYMELANKVKKYFSRKKTLFLISDPGIKEEQIRFEVYRKLVKKYSYVLNRQYSKPIETKTKTIWLCWLQGYDEAPELCKVCIDRIKQLYGNSYDIVILTKENLGRYVTLPAHIIEKWKDGRISNVHFSDLLRISLLVEKGGIWMDSTLLLLDKVPEYVMNSNVFFFKGNSKKVINVSNWFIVSSYIHSPLLTCVRDLLDEYWKKENYPVHYNICHMFMMMAAERYSDEYDSIPMFPSDNAHILTREIFCRYDSDRISQIRDLCPIQKLNRKKTVPKTDDTFYDCLITKRKIFDL